MRWGSKRLSQLLDFIKGLSPPQWTGCCNQWGLSPALNEMVWEQQNQTRTVKQWNKSGPLHFAACTLWQQQNSEWPRQLVSAQQGHASPECCSVAPWSTILMEGLTSHILSLYRDDFYPRTLPYFWITLFMTCLALTYSGQCFLPVKW